MLSTRLLSSARTRFLATTATVFALVALGGVVATPAYADAAALRIIDASTGSAWAYGNFVLTSTGGGDTSFATDGSGYWTQFIADGDYYISSTGSNATVPSDVFNIHIGQTYYDVYVDTYKVSGTIPTDADEGLTAVSVQYYNGSSWGPVGVTLDPSTVGSSDGSFLMRAPQGPGDYRLVFQPDPSTPYTETFVPFTVDGGAAVVALGAISLNQTATISGSVYAADGITALSGATVHATVAGSDVATGTSDGTGAYSIALPPGDADYDVWAEASYYDDSIAQTVSLNATDGYGRTGIDFLLSPTLVTLTGSVLNYFNFGSEIRAELYAGGTASPTFIADTALVGGDYSLPNVPATGTYFIKLVPSGVDAFLPTLLGDGGTTAWAQDASAESAFSVASSFTVDPDVPSSLVHDATISGAAVFRGYLSSFGAAIDESCVTLTEVNTLSSICVVPESDGSYFYAVPATGSYTVHAWDALGAYIEQWFDGADSELDATVIGPVTAGQFIDINFGLYPSPATIHAFAHDVVDTDPITVHLYFLDNGEWRDAGEGDTVYGPNEVIFDRNFYTGVADGLSGGDYRLRFQDSDGNWIAATTYDAGLLPAGAPAPIAGPVCYIDISNVTQGRANYVDATFDIANDTAGCGPQPLNYGDVNGHFETSIAYGSADVVDHLATLWNDDYTDYSLTNASGNFHFELIPNGEYTLDLVPDSHVYGDHEYSFSQSGIVLTGGDVDLGPLVATRNGNAFGTISNWDGSTMSGATVTIYTLVSDPGGDFWEQGPIDVPIQSSGYFEVPGIDANGEYAVLITFADTYSPVFIGGGYLEPVSPFTGIAEEDYDLGSVTVATTELVTISGTALFGTFALEYGFVIAHPVGGCSCAEFTSTVDLDGTYSIEVVPNVDYEVAAVDPVWAPLLLAQLYSGHNYPYDYSGPYDADVVEVGATDVTDINFSLVATDEVFVDTFVESWDESDDTYEDFPDVEVHLYKYVVDGWEEVDTVTTDSYAEAYLGSSGDGDYRLRFSKDGDWLAVHTLYSELYYPYAADEVVDDTFDPEQCYIDLDDVQHGSYVWAEISLIADASTTSCGPEILADHNDIMGTIVTTGTWGYDPIPGQELTLTNDATDAEFYATTDGNGVYVFENAPEGTYTLSAPTMPFPFVGMTFAPKTVTGIVVDEDEALDPIELTSYGAAFVQITNWDSSMVGATAQLYINHPDVGGDHWSPVGLTDTVDSGGYFLVPGIAEDGEYSVWIDYPTGFVDTFLTDVSSAATINTFNGYAEYNQTGLETIAYTTVSGTVRIGAAAVSGASISVESPYSDVYPTTTAANGTYSVAVPVDLDYSVYATKSGLVRDIITTLHVGFAPVTGADLEMHYATFLTSLYSAVATPTSATVHLYKQVSGGWQEVASDTASTTFLWANIAGSYRVRFSDGADWLAVSDYQWDNDAGPESSGYVQPVPNVCFIDFSPAIAGAEYELEALVLTPPSGVVCAAEPAVVAPPSTPGSAGAGKKHVAEPVTDETTEEEPEPTPTPTPESSESPTDDPGDGPGDDTPPPATPDLSWAFWGAGLLALLILCGGAFFVIRRRP